MKIQTQSQPSQRITRQDQSQAGQSQHRQFQKGWWGHSNSGRGEVFTFEVEMSPANPHLFMCLVDAFVYRPFICKGSRIPLRR